MRSTLSKRISSIYIFLALFFGIDNVAAGVGTAETLRNDKMFKGKRLTSRLRGGRNLNTLTTPNCSTIRTAEYPAELQLFYTYSVEINDDLLLNDMERAIDNAVAIELDMCDVKGRPVYKVRTSTTHSFSTSRRC